MSSTTAVSIENVSKKYLLGRAAPIGSSLRSALSRSKTRDRNVRNELWALKDVSFEITPGRAVGIIGANGAGKTTLLKILSRITEPTGGRIVVQGRVGSLLEVGTGFHPELTGRENVFLNGAILGMRRAEIAAHYDEIVEFAELAQFMQTPVKRYSTGMYVRLAFAVAAHLESEILLVDEVLSVGDLAFQRKCLGKMQEQTDREGRTVVFVSHSLGAIRSLTEECVWLESGEVRRIGPTSDVVSEYVLSHGARGEGFVDLSDLSAGRPPGKELRHALAFESVTLESPDGIATDIHHEGDPLRVRVALRCRVPSISDEVELIARVRTLEGVYVLAALGGKHRMVLAEGVYETAFAIDSNPLRPGTYQLELYCLTQYAQDLVPSAATFTIESNPRPGDDPRLVGPLDLGLVRVEARWETLEPARRSLS